MKLQLRPPLDTHPTTVGGPSHMKLQLRPPLDTEYWILQQESRPTKCGTALNTEPESSGRYFT